MQPRGTLNIDVALTKQNYITVHWLNSQVLIISIHCRRNTTEFNGHLFLNKNIRVWLSYPVSSQTYLKSEDEDGGTIAIFWLLNLPVIYEKRHPISTSNITEKEAEREVKVIYSCKFIVVPWSQLCLATRTAFEDLGGNLQVVERFCRDSCQIRLLSLRVVWETH